MTARLELRVDEAPFERAVAELAVAGFFLDERPLRGAAGRADWRLCGAASELLTSKHLRGRVGEAALIPAFGRLTARRVLLLGLGRRSSFRPSRAHEATAAALRRAVLLGATDIALAPLVATPQDVTPQLGGLLRAASAVVRESSIELSLRVVVPGGQAAGALDALQRALADGPAEDTRLIELILPGSRTSPQGSMVPMGRPVV